MFSLISVAKAVDVAPTGDDEVHTLKDLEGIFGNVVNVIIGFAGIVFFIMLLFGGFRYLTAGSDPKKAEGARNTLTMAILGLVFIALALLFIRLLENFTGANLSNFQIYQGP